MSNQTEHSRAQFEQSVDFMTPRIPTRAGVNRRVDDMTIIPNTNGDEKPLQGTEMSSTLISENANQAKIISRPDSVAKIPSSQPKVSSNRNEAQLLSEARSSNDKPGVPAPTENATQKTNETGNVSEKITPCDLTVPQSKWDKNAYIFFTEKFNQSRSAADMKKLTGQTKLEKIQCICSKCDLLGLPIDKKKMQDYFLTDTDERWRSPILSVCKGDYLRLSGSMTRQFGFELKEGQKFHVDFTVKENKKWFTFTLIE